MKSCMVGEILASGSLLPRLGLCVLIIIGSALWRIWRGDRQRWKEYAFLLCCVAAAMAYGIANDQVTVTLSPEYIYHHGGELGLAIQAAGPEDPIVRLTALEMGAKASWFVGLLLGVAILLGNNPRKDGRPQMRYGFLARMVGVVLLAAAAAALTGGLAGWVLSGEAAPDKLRRFYAVWGAHLGSYAGGFLGAAAAVVWLVRRRRTSPSTQRSIIV